ncbi:MAG: 23S rRNA (adenine(2030)-N(6))-methyltransferase RlmJ [Hyphomicrobiales bacterium]|nr:23S rRNA (adenine(2030)-N(6))-methyltransferase RlmJ [Hyphomicrobiales bacterium]
MNYRHEYHAGNFADVFKHIILTRILAYLMRKDTGAVYIDTHAGAGHYDLGGAAARATGEAMAGVGRLKPPFPPLVADLVADWARLCGVDAGRGMPASYPGSPLIAQQMLRAQDRLCLAEKHHATADSLNIACGVDRRLKIFEADGYATLKALVPPPERRGLVLIDPPFEATSEFADLRHALDAALKRWAQGTYAIWYPVKDQEPERLAAHLAAAGLDKVLRLELDIDSPAPGALSACGMIIINAPYVLAEEARRLLPWLAQTLRQGDNPRWRVDEVRAG